MTPLVSIDINDVIKSEGESVTVYINDRKSVYTGKELKEYLKTIPADNLMKIEVITSPSAKYETGGQVINIVLKKNENEGIKGSATFNNNHSKNNSQYSNFNLNYHKKSFTQTLSGSYSDNTNVNTSQQENFFYSNNARNFINSVSKSFYKSPSFSTTSELELDKLNTIGFIFEYYKAKNNNESDIFGNNFVDDLFKKSFTTAKNSEGNSQNIGSNLFYKYYDKEKNRILDVNVGINYSGFKGDTENIINNSDSPLITGTKILTNTQERNYYLKIDYSQPIGKEGSQLEFGGKIDFNNNTIPSQYFALDNDLFLFDTNKSNNFQYKDNLNSLYANFSTTIFKKLETRIGLRFEHISYTVKQEVGNVESKRSYGTILPDLLLKYSLSENYNLTATYKHNIWRPWYSEFNPFLFPSDDGTYYKGNIDLQANPSDRFNLKLGMYKKYFLSGSYSFSNKDYWSSYIIEDGKTISVPTNFDGLTERYSLNFSTNQTFLKNKLSINFNVGANYIDNSDFNAKNNLDAKDYITNINGSTNFSYTNLFSKNININAWVGVYSQNSGNTVGNKNNIYHSMSITKIFEPLEMEVSLRLNNIFLKPSSDVTTFAPIGTFKNLSTYDWYGIGFSLVKRFGNQKVKENSKTNVEKESGGGK